MSVLSVDDWNDFFFKVGEDFYDLVNGEDGDENTAIDYDVLCSYTGAFKYDYYYDSSHYFEVKPKLIPTAGYIFPSLIKSVIILS